MVEIGQARSLTELFPVTRIKLAAAGIDENMLEHYSDSAVSYVYGKDHEPHEIDLHCWSV
jgi:hypothetical protein